jgi:hypothetical protein
MIYGNYILGVKRDFQMGKTFAWPTTSFDKEGRFGPIEQNAQIFKSVQLNLTIFFCEHFSPLLISPHEYDNSVLLPKDITQYII